MARKFPACRDVVPDLILYFGCIAGRMGLLRASDGAAF